MSLDKVIAALVTMGLKEMERTDDFVRLQDPDFPFRNIVVDLTQDNMSMRDILNLLEPEGINPDTFFATAESL